MNKRDSVTNTENHENRYYYCAVGLRRLIDIGSAPSGTELPETDKTPKTKQKHQQPKPEPANRRHLRCNCDCQPTYHYNIQCSTHSAHIWHT